jgi:hypothetical protein
VHNGCREVGEEWNAPGRPLTIPLAKSELDVLAVLPVNMQSIESVDQK